MAEEKVSPVIPYNPGFLGEGFAVPLPRLLGPAREHAFRNGHVFDYTHYSLVMNERRRLATFTAANVDGARWVSLGRGKWWRRDPRADVIQPEDAFFDETWTRGHLVRRQDVCWGPRGEAEKANRNTFYFTNAAPQHKNFNGDEWGELEDWFLDHAKGDRARAMVFTGCVFRADDPTLESHGVVMQVPAGFWKIVVARDASAIGNDLTASGFILKQNELWNDSNGAKFKPLTRYQVPIALIERLTCLDFGALRSVDPVAWQLDRSVAHGADVIEIDSTERLAEVQRLNVERHRANRRYPVTRARSCACDRAKSACSCNGASGSSAAAPAVDAALAALAARISLLEQEIESDRLPDEQRRAFVRDLRRQRLPGQAETNRILGGQPTASNQYKDCVCLGDDNDYFCTGVLVGPNVVVTAAHCVFDRWGNVSPITRAFIGSDLSDSDSGTETVVVTHTIPHPKYTPGGSDERPSHDIAVLVLERAAAKATPVGLIAPADVQSISTLLVGFGTTDPGASEGFGVKREVTVPILYLWKNSSDDHLKAQAAVKGFHLHTEFVAEAKRHDADTCAGDSGGPAYVKQGDGSKRYLLGLTSRAVEDYSQLCGDGGVYTLVAPHADWVEQAASAAGGTLTWRPANPNPSTPPTPPTPPAPHPPTPPAPGFEPGCC